ncbi:MAG: radical SAM family heme chaperone HemW [Spirochaetes bacterium]|nr:radical SAM family heme chaperone HemW [Spirochaetota bacterium]
MSLPLSLYIHIPFCNSFCDYCDFYSVMAKKNNQIDVFIDSLIADINYQIEYFNVNEINTVYIGGGTPSVFGKRITVLLDALKKFKWFSPAEFTVEANPESTTEDFLCACKEGGVNRLSLGVQTFHEPSRKAVNRIGDSALLERRLALAKRFFPDSLSVDLITGLPFQNEKTVLNDINRLLVFEPGHISLYSLTVEDNTPLEKKIKANEINLPGNDFSDSLWLSCRDALEDAGFCHYEISNFAKNGKVCRHNIRYWLMEGWIGAGPAASGTVINEENGTAKRFTYAPDIDAYNASPFIKNATCEELDKNILMRESLLMGFRYCEGPDKYLFKKRFGCSVEDCIPKTLDKWKNKDIMLFLNSFLSDAFNELD